jgi:hypothetical protein
VGSDIASVQYVPTGTGVRVVTAAWIVVAE